MRESDGACRIDAVAVTKIVIEGGSSSIGVQAALLGKVGDATMTFGNTVVKTGWPEEVAELTSQLCEAIEDHLAQVLFEEDYNVRNHSSDRGDSVPAGLVESGLDAANDETEQL